MELISKEYLEVAKSNALQILKENLQEFTYKFQYSTSINNFYPASENTQWTNGFVTGQYWLAYELTRDESFKQSAEVQVDSFLERIKKKSR